MSHRKRLIIATLLPPVGRCGVQTHLNAIAECATAAGLAVRVVTPQGASLWARRFVALVRDVVTRVSRERAVLWNRTAAAWFLKSQLRRTLTSEPVEPAIIYAQDPLSAKVALELRREGLMFRLVAVVHFNVSEAYEQVISGNTREGGSLWKNLMANETAVLPKLDLIVFVSSFMRATVMARLPQLFSIDHQVISNFPPHLSVGGYPPLSATGDLLAIGTLESRKNQSYLFRVLAEAKRRGHRYTLTLAGDGPDEKYLRELAAELQIADQLHFLGFVTGAARLLLAHRVLVHAAEMENMPLSLLEGLSQGRPILAPAVGGIPEIFSNGIEGNFWPLDDPVRGAELLIGVLEDHAVYARMCAAATKRYEDYYRPEVLGPVWLEHLRGTTQIA